VAGVFVNRLRIGMPLQTDPTVIYGLGETFDGNLRKRDLLADTPFNTYTRRGLPPTPIALPGLASLRAAVRPEPTRRCTSWRAATAAASSATTWPTTIGPSTPTSVHRSAGRPLEARPLHHAEGIDGAGKTSHLEALAEHLSWQRGHEVVATREPGGTPLAEELRALVLHRPMDALTEALLVFAARRDHLQQHIEPALARGVTGCCATASPTPPLPTRAAAAASTPACWPSWKAGCSRAASPT
jgi:hypothetical protein